jgi:hypothetical protein
MNRYFMICRLRWPAFLLLTGIIALLDQANILSWGRAWPLYLILWGVLALAERAMLASGQGQIPVVDPYAAGYPAPGYAAPGYPAAGYAPPAAPYTPAPAAPVQSAETGIVPAHGTSTLDLRNTDEEGR